MDNKGWIRIVEASISIILIMTTLFVVYQKSAYVSPPDLTIMGRQVLEEAAHNETLRLALLTEDVRAQDYLNAFIRSRIISRSFSFEAKICQLNDVCGKSNYTSGDVYAAERVFAAAVTDQQSLRPKKVRLFIWRV